MNTIFFKTATLCFTSAVLLSGCGSSDGDAVPANSLTITPSNATATVTSAVSSADLVLSEIPASVEITQAPSALDIVKLVDDLTKNRADDSVLSIATGIVANASCDSGNGNIETTYTATSTSNTGTISFSACNLAGVALNGTATYDLSWTMPSGPYDYHITGNVSADHNGLLTTIGQLNYQVMGDNSTGDFSVDPFDHSVSYSNGQGFTVSLLEPITGNVNTDNQCPLAGTVLVTGANGTQAKATIVYPDINIEYNDGNGSFALVETVPCTEVFPVQRPFLLRYL